MRVTGNKTFNLKSISIQSSLNGYTFYDTLGRRLATDVSDREDINVLLKQLRKLTNKININIDIPSYVAIPSALYDPTALEHYFKVKSIAYNNNRYKYIGYHLLDDTVTVVVPFDLYVYDLISALFNDVTYSHPIVEVLEMAGNRYPERCIVYTYSSQSHFAMLLVNEGKLLFCDYINMASNSDILYYIRVLIEEKGVSPSLILCGGDDTDSLVQSVGRYHPNVRNL